MECGGIPIHTGAANIYYQRFQFIMVVFLRVHKDHIETVAMPLVFIYSSLSVFALHPLYLRVQALSDSIPADVKVYLCYASIFIHFFCIGCVVFTFHCPPPHLVLNLKSITGRNSAGEEAFG